MNMISTCSRLGKQFLFVLLVAGCAANTLQPTERAPLALKPDNENAILVGQTIGGILNNRVFVWFVDGNLVPDPLSTSEKPIRVPPGTREVIVGQKAGAFEANVKLAFHAEPNNSYQLRAAQVDKPWYNQQIYSAGGETLFWVENYSTGEVVSERQTVMVGIGRDCVKTVVSKTALELCR